MWSAKTINCVIGTYEKLRTSETVKRTPDHRGLHQIHESLMWRSMGRKDLCQRSVSHESQWLLRKSYQPIICKMNYTRGRLRWIHGRKICTFMTEEVYQHVDMFQPTQVYRLVVSECASGTLKTKYFFCQLTECVVMRYM